MYNVIRKYTDKKNSPPCEAIVWYSVDGGETWMSSKQYAVWKSKTIVETWLT